MQETKTINGQTQKTFRITNEKLKTTLNKMGINDTLIEITLPKFNKSDTLMILKTGERIKQPDMTNLYRIKVPANKKRQDIIEVLRKMPEVLYAEPNGKVIHHTIPSDTRFGEQWGLRNTIRPGADIHAEAAWDIYTGNANNTIAIIDGGTQATHSDLNDKISGGDVGFGWDGHGIHVSGIAAAESNNAQGISGVDWQARIHPQRIDNVNDGVGIYQAIIDAVNFSPNVHVLNNSWGLSDEYGNSGRYSTTVRLAFAYAYKANRTSVVLMGNHQETQPGVVGYPAGFDNVIAVGATNNADGIANFSAQGSHIDVCAPGVDILSTINSGYGFMSGTSMAAPHVSGIASLLKGFNPNLANNDIENIIKLSADKVQHMNGQTFTNAYGFGRVNAERALNLLRAPNTISQWSATSGTIASSSGTFKMVFLGAPGLASSTYIVKRHEVRKVINYTSQFLHIEGVWGRGVFTSGWGLANPNFGEGFCEVVPGTQTNTSVTLRTYVYEVWSITGSYLGYYPKSPSNVTFAYTVIGVPAPTINGPSLICSEGASFTLNGLPTGSTISWTYSSNLQLVNSGSNYITLKAIGNGSGWIQATITSMYGTYTTPQKAVWVGKPVLQYIQGPITVQQNVYYTYYAQPNNNNNATYYWYVYPSYASYTSSVNWKDISFSNIGYNTLVVKAQNACGWSSNEPNLEIEVYNYGYFSLSPNPVSDNVEITVHPIETIKSNTSKNTSEITYIVQIYDSYGTPVYTNKKIGNSFTLSTANLKDGLYMVGLNDGKQIYWQRLTVKH